jgi:hypothetical protein
MTVTLVTVGLVLFAMFTSGFAIGFVIGSRR